MASRSFRLCRSRSSLVSATTPTCPNSRFWDWRGIGDGASTFPDGRAGALSMRKKSGCSWPSAIPSMVLVARLPELHVVQQWPLPSYGAHGMDINHRANLLYVACDGGSLVEVDAQSGEVRREWPLAGVPDANLLQSEKWTGARGHRRSGTDSSLSIPRTGTQHAVHHHGSRREKRRRLSSRIRLYVFSPLHKGILDLRGA